MRLVTVWAWAMLWAWAALLRAIGGVDMVMFGRVLVESSWFSKVDRETKSLSSLVLCGAECTRVKWCQLWCLVQPGECLLTSLVVSGSYQPLELNDIRLCYTSRRPDFAVGSSIFSSQRYDDTRPKENLVDGIYNWNVMQSSIIVSDNATAWFLVDLGVPRRVSKVLLIAQPTDLARHWFQDLEVRVGDIQETGNFTSYTLLGTFVGPGNTSQVVVIRPSAPLVGRYVSIQRMTEGRLQISHLEIR
ncbi:uncharacterized protein LOC135109695 [Scylla paramamosain]|uniref:uncharacterized protein LOC135109695 n=1 Tax=Scylla paramamosain TaxID=85552 RepID=UPI003083830D